VPLNDEATAALCSLIEYARNCGSTRPEHYLLPADLSRHTSPTDPLHGRTGFDPARPQRTLRTAWHNLRKAAGIEGIRFHDLRHTAATKMLSAGIPVATVMQIMGHTEFDQTLYYNHTPAEERMRAVLALSGSTGKPTNVVSIDALLPKARKLAIGGKAATV